MKTLSITGLFKPISEADVKQFETSNGITLPAYLQVFFLKYNGARLAENHYTADNRTYIVSVIPLIRNAYDTSVEDILPAVRDEEEGIGRDDLVPFATDPGGRPFYVSVGEADEGAVYYDTVGMGMDEAVRKIADTFEQFVDGLMPE